MKDCVNKGRHFSPFKKLTEEQITYILESDKTSTEVSKELSVSPSAIRYRRRKAGQKRPVGGLAHLKNNQK